MSAEKGAESWRDTHLGTSYKGFFLYIHICVCVYIREQSLCLNTSDWSEQQMQLQVIFFKTTYSLLWIIMPVLAAIIRNLYTVLSWNRCLCNIVVAQSALLQVHSVPDGSRNWSTSKISQRFAEKNNKQDLLQTCTRKVIRGRC